MSSDKRKGVKNVYERTGFVELASDFFVDTSTSRRRDQFEKLELRHILRHERAIELSFLQTRTCKSILCCHLHTSMKRPSGTFSRHMVLECLPGLTVVHTRSSGKENLEKGDGFRA